MRERDECRPVTLPSGETIILRGRGEPSPEVVAALGEVVDAARRHHERLHPVDPAAAELWARIEAARGDLYLTEIAKQAGVKRAVLFRIGQGRMPGAGDLAAIEAWLAASETGRA